MTITPATLRLDLKCGNGSISKGEKCTKGASTSAPQAKRAPKATGTERFLKKAGIIGAAGGLGYTAAGLLLNKPDQALAGVSAFMAGSSAYNAGEAMGYERRGQKAKATASKVRAISSGVYAVGGAGLLGYQAYSLRRHARRVATGHNAARNTANNFNNDPGGFGGGYNPGGDRRYTGSYSRNNNAGGSSNAGGSYAYGRYSTGYGRGNNAGGYGSNNAGGYGSNNAGGYGRRNPFRNYNGDPFKDLGVSPSASAEELKKAWKSQMRKHHPDLGGDPEQAKKVNQAYQAILKSKGIKDSIYADGFTIDWDAIAL